MGVDEDLAPLSWSVTIAFFAICAISFALRMYTRGFIARSFGWDDRFMAIAFILLIGQQYICWKWLILGAGKHVRAVSSEELEKMRLYQFIEEFYYFLVQLFVKLSFLLFFHRTIYTPRLSTAIRLVALVILVQTIATWIFYALQCRPLAAYFNPRDYPDAVCLSRAITYCGPSILNAVFNLLIYILPIPILARHTHQGIRAATASPPPPSNTSTSPEPFSTPEPPPSRPAQSTPATATLFVIGGVGITVSCLRIGVLYQWATTASADYPYALGIVAIVTTIELSVYVIAGNLPSLRTLWLHHKSRSDGNPEGGEEGHEMRRRKRRHRRQRRHGGGGGGEHDSEDELWGVGGAGAGKAGAITITSRVSISITEALRGAQGVQRDGLPYYPKKYFKFARPGARSPTPNFLKELGG